LTISTSWPGSIRRVIRGETVGRNYHLRWLGPENGEPPVSPRMTLRMEPGHEVGIVER